MNRDDERRVEILAEFVERAHSCWWVPMMSDSKDQRIGFNGATGVMGGSNRKLTSQQVREIRDSSEAVKAAARRYGVSPKTIRNIRNGSRYRSVA